MGLLRRVAFTNSLVSGMIGKRRTKNTFDPRFATRLATYRFTPEISATTMINVETESTIPNNIRKERSLCERSVSRATKIGSRKLIRVFMISSRGDGILHELSHSQEAVTRGACISTGLQ